MDRNIRLLPKAIRLTDERREELSQSESRKSPSAGIKDMYVDAGGATFVAIRWCECSQSDRLIKF